MLTLARAKRGAQLGASPAHRKRSDGTACASPAEPIMANGATVRGIQKLYHEQLGRRCEIGKYSPAIRDGPGMDEGNLVAKLGREKIGLDGAHRRPLVDSNTRLQTERNDVQVTQLFGAIPHCTRCSISASLLR
jgi:hypothetical protein